MLLETGGMGLAVGGGLDVSCIFFFWRNENWRLVGTEE
jgi:hypothetical protein